MKSRRALGIAVVGILLFQGCETVKGAGQGVVKDTDNTYENVSTALQKSKNAFSRAFDKTVEFSRNLNTKAKEADVWWRENLW